MARDSFALFSSCPCALSLGLVVACLVLGEFALRAAV